MRGAWDAVQSFLSRCTLSSPPESITLTACQATEWDPDVAAAEACIARVVARFGPPHQTQGLGRHWPSGEPLQGGVLTWQGSAETLEELVAFLRTVGPALPFALLPRHFRLATPKRDGSGYRYRRLTDPPPIPAV